jgi:hypothetical protein
MARAHADRVEEDLRWIDAHIGGRPYGVDILMPSTYEDVAQVDIDALPAEHVAFVQKLLDDAGIPRLPPEQAAHAARELLSGLHMTPREPADAGDLPASPDQAHRQRPGQPAQGAGRARTRRASRSARWPGASSTLSATATLAVIWWLPSAPRPPVTPATSVPWCCGRASSMPWRRCRC